MSPRPYQVGVKRQAATEQTRSRIIDAARELLMSDEPGAFSIDAVARNAGVARMTVYYQFESKHGLLTALFDHLSERGQMVRLREAFVKDDPLDALERFIDVFMHFYDRNRAIVRRLNALAVLDPELETALTERDDWRRAGLRTLLERFGNTQGKRSPRSVEDTLAVLHTLTSFHTFDALTTNERSAKQAGKLIFQLARGVLDLKV